MSKKLAIQNACADYDYRWPKDLPSGVMFYYGEKITIDEFNSWACKFRCQKPVAKTSES